MIKGFGKEIGKLWEWKGNEVFTELLPWRDDDEVLGDS